MRALAWTLASVVLASCATPVVEQTAALERAQVCCAAYSELSYPALELDKPKSVRLGEGSPAYVFDTGKSFFYAARLPPFSDALLLKIESEGTLAGEGKTSVFRPEILLLDRDYQVTRRIAGDGFRRTGVAALQGSVFINPDNAAETYVVVFTRTGAQAGTDTIKMFTGHSFSLGGPPITLTGEESIVSLNYSPAGSLTLLLSKYQPQRIAK